jgi:hypothetical protein
MEVTGMDSHTTLVNATRAAEDLVQRARSLQHQFGNTLDVRRVVDDVQRLKASLEALVDSVAPDRSQRCEELEFISDVEYDLGFWMDADHEGVGGLRRLDDSA